MLVEEVVRGGVGVACVEMVEMSFWRCAKVCSGFGGVCLSPAGDRRLEVEDLLRCWNGWRASHADCSAREDPCELDGSDKLWERSCKLR